MRLTLKASPRADWASKEGWDYLTVEDHDGVAKITVVENSSSGDERPEFHFFADWSELAVLGAVAKQRIEEVAG